MRHAGTSVPYFPWGLVENVGLWVVAEDKGDVVGVGVGIALLCVGVGKLHS